MARLNFLGFVISQGKMNKTIKVRVLQKKFDKKVQKHFLQKKDFLVHDEGNICKEGDFVRIEQTRPLSSKKFFAVAEIRKNKGQQFLTYQKEAKNNVINEENDKINLFKLKQELNNKNVELTESFYNDLNKIKDLKLKKELNDDELKRINEIKEKYNITQENNVFTPSVNELSEKINDLAIGIKLSNTVNKLFNDESNNDKLNKIFEKINVNESTQKNIKKNLVRKYIKTAPISELEQLGLSI